MSGPTGRKHLQQLAGAVSEEKHRAEIEAAAAAEDEVARLRGEVVRAEAGYADIARLVILSILDTGYLS
jgi:hypothetical protein